MAPNEYSRYKKINIFLPEYVGVLISLAFLISSFLICSTIKIIFLGWVKEVRTTKS
jgi:hypothetical protein